MPSVAARVRAYYKIFRACARAIPRHSLRCSRHARRRRRRPRTRHRARTRRRAACRSRWSRRATSARRRPSIIRTPCMAACARCRRGRIDRARESIRERRALARIAPRLLRTLPFIVGTYRSWIEEPPRAARGVPDRQVARPASQRRRRARAASARSAARIARRHAEAFSRRFGPDGLTGGAMWYDYQMVQADRLTIAFAEAADAARRPTVELRAGDRTASCRIGAVAGMRVRDRLDRTRDRRPRPRDHQRRRIARRRDHAGVRRALATSRSCRR